MKVIKFIAVFHYHKEDEECLGDCWDIELFEANPINDPPIMKWRDDYHDNGQNKLEGFLEGVAWALDKEVECDIQNVADRDY